MRVPTDHSFSRVNCTIIPLDTHPTTVWKTGLPVRSAVLKPHAGELVVGWVTTSESSLLRAVGLRKSRERWVTSTGG
ncbi:L-lysine 2-3-aminomutase [Penicillium cf. griseofulvum]|nr:L-lysine 2-3-aminomutase [Penicillium cf. griseofulvum]